MDIEIKRGDLVYVNLEPIIGSETGKKRPCVIIQNNIGNKYSPVTIVAIITNQKEISKKYPVDVWIDKGEGELNYASIVQCDQIRTIDKRRIIKNIGHLSDSIIQEIDEAIKISLELD
ncbi:Endoribonuclease EndoA [subsurface metagenome]